MIRETPVTRIPFLLELISFQISIDFITAISVPSRNVPEENLKFSLGAAKKQKMIGITQG